MCGIVAVLGRPSLRRPPSSDEVRECVSAALAHLELAAAPASAAGDEQRLSALRKAAAGLRAADARLRGVPGLLCLTAGDGSPEVVDEAVARAGALLADLEGVLDSGRVGMEGRALEELNASLVEARDAVFALGRDRLESYRAVSDMYASLTRCLEGAGGRSGRGGPGGPAAGAGRPAVEQPGPAALAVLWALNVALRSLDRLEVRGRDSAGVHVMLAGHGFDLDSPEELARLGGRSQGDLFTSLSVRPAEGCLSIVYKVAAEIGELGDNVAALRQAIANDPLLAEALCSPELRATVVAHTRWASVGLVNEANAHPLNSEEIGPGAPGRLGDNGHNAHRDHNGSDQPGPYVIGALNGDVDNYAALVASEGLQIPPEVTTDAKVVPTLVARRLGQGEDMGDAFRHAVARFEGSVGIAVNAAGSPDDLYLALRGSGQGLNIGLAEDAFVIASEAYGLVEEATVYLRMDGEGGGQVVRCSRAGAGSLAGISRTSYQGKPLPVGEDELTVAAITTRDIDRRGYRHFLLKEIHEAPLSVRKTLRGKVVAGPGGRLSARLGEGTVPASLARALADGRLSQVVVVGQGTAAVAGQAVASAIARALPAMAVKALPATELSGWGPAGLGLPDDMSNILVVAISQSGTTTDTNRTVDLVRARGAYVVSIVNRRNSDLVQKSHGVLYTSDGRDVEMSVASTKAFYSQVVAGHLLALGLAEAAGRAARTGAAPAPGTGPDRAGEILDALRELPSQLESVLAQRPRIARVAAATAPWRRSWAVVGSGPDRVAAAEVRIKLSELCYKAIALDSIEDKKHIDLSAEPLVIVCAPSVTGPNAQDIAKEIKIFEAHKAAPVVIASESEKDRFGAGTDIVSVPDCHPELAFVLAAMAGHIFGYEAALAIDSQARPLREARALLEGAAGQGVGGQEVPAEGAEPGALALKLEAAAQPALVGLRSGAYDGCLNASTGSRLVSLLRYATGALPVEGYEAEMGKVGSPAAIATDLIAALGAAIDELTRPIDAIKHQAKTVTVGISRNEQPLLEAPLVHEALAAGATVESLGYRSLRTLSALGPAVEEILGFTRYRIDAAPGASGEASLAGATVDVVDQGGIARGIASRTATDKTLRGTKHRAAEKREVTVFRGLHDGRTGLMVPEVKDGQVTGLTLLHARFADVLAPPAAKAVLQAYQGRYGALVDAVTEARPDFDDEVLGEVPMIELLTEPVALLAHHWSA